MSRQVPLSRGLTALVDDADFERVVALGKWYADRAGDKFCARKNFWTGSGYRSVRMHNFITGWEYVDHINGDPLDNRRANLRQATHQQNTWNRPGRAGSRSGFKGVTLVRGKWLATIRTNGHRQHLGTFRTPELAALAYDAAAADLFGEFAYLNFPKEHA